MKDINKIECGTCGVGVEVADEVAGEYSQGKLNLISRHWFIGDGITNCSIWWRCQFYESSEHEENINNILNQSDEAIQTERSWSHTSLGMGLPPKKKLHDVAAKQLSALSKSLNIVTLTSKNKKKKCPPFGRDVSFPFLIFDCPRLQMITLQCF